MNDELIVQLIDLPNTYIGEAPLEHDTCQWVKLSSGTSKIFFGRKTIDRPEYVVYVRDSSNKSAYDTAQACFKKLQLWNDEHRSLIVTRNPSYVGRDEKHRCVYSFRVQFITGG